VVNALALLTHDKDLAGQIVNLSPNLPSEAAIILKNIENPSFLIHFVSSNLNSDIKEKQRLLEINNIKSRAELLMNLMQTELQYTELKNKVTNKTRAELDKQQREYFLQQQMKAIKDELGGDNVAEVKEMLKKSESKNLSDVVEHSDDGDVASIGGFSNPFEMIAISVVDKNDDLVADASILMKEFAFVQTMDEIISDTIKLS
jgi:ATP-dependent Lon protease